MPVMNETAAVLVRGLFAFVTLLIYCRILGKEQIKQLTFFDYVTGITIGSIASMLTANLNDRPWPYFVALTGWMFLTFFLQWATLRWRYLAKVIDGEPVVVVMNGQLMDDTMRKARLKVTDLLGLLRISGVFDLTEVEFAVYEKNGNLSVLRKSQYQPVKAADLNLTTAYKGLSTELVYNGVIIEQNLRDLHLGREWLDRELKKSGVGDPAEVFLANLDTQGNLYVDKYRDYIRHKTDISDYNGPN
jgi:uncharacterized membrane protein YcaP (DUF421 family)